MTAAATVAGSEVAAAEEAVAVAAATTTASDKRNFPVAAVEIFQLTNCLRQPNFIFHNFKFSHSLWTEILQSLLSLRDLPHKIAGSREHAMETIQQICLTRSNISTGSEGKGHKSYANLHQF